MFTIGKIFDMKQQSISVPASYWECTQRNKTEILLFFKVAQKKFLGDNAI